VSSWEVCEIAQLEVPGQGCPRTDRGCPCCDRGETLGLACTKQSGWGCMADDARTTGSTTTHMLGAVCDTRAVKPGMLQVPLAWHVAAAAASHALVIAATAAIAVTVLPAAAYAPPLQFDDHLRPAALAKVRVCQLLSKTPAHHQHTFTHSQSYSHNPIQCRYECSTGCDTASGRTRWVWSVPGTATPSLHIVLHPLPPAWHCNTISTHSAAPLAPRLALQHHLYT
jgi:hypothetical protein